MAKKKNKPVSVSQEDNIQAQQVLEHYHEVAQNLRLSTDQKQAESALTEINNMSEGAQVALLKALSKEHHTDAADVLLAINELSPIKDVRKEARRSLIQLEGARIYPRWRPPVQQPFALQVTDIPLHFWKGIVTDSLDVGEVQLVLAFEQGEDANEIRVLGFLLEFLHDGVKDFFTRIESKRSLENFIAQMSTRMGDIQTKECSLAEGRRLLLDALAVNKKYGTLPHKDYRYNLSLVNRLVLEAPDLDEDADLDEENEENIDLHDLDPQAVVINFVESWINGEYDIAYDLLSSDSALREGLSREEWIERREAWAEEADPGDLEPDFIHEREPRESKLWLPNSFSARQGTTRKEIEVGWSIELDQTPISETLPEFPQATAIYEETGRHWFWTSYTLIQEQEEWRIQSMTDEGANALALPVAELQKRGQEHDKYLQESTQELTPTDIDEEEAQLDLNAILWHLMVTIYYYDALIKELPLDRSLYLEAAGRLVLIHKYERAIVYLEPLARRFTEQRAEVLRQLAAVEIELSKQYFEKEDDERAERFQELAAEALRESLAIENSFEAHISLAELLLDENERLDEAEDHLLQAKTMVTEPSDEAHIELHLGEIAMEREQYEEALSHYQHVAEHDPSSAEAWFDIAEAHNKLGNFAEAEANYKRAIELEPDNENYYIALSEMYIENQQGSKAIKLIEEAIEDNPDSATLYVALASIYLRNEDYRQAAIFIAKAERIDPESPDVQLARQVLTLAKAVRAPNFAKLNRPKKKRRR
jgi:tetratricopeptide (TPR) repeat protein